MSFESDIQKWVTLDNKLKILNEEIKELRDQRNKLSENVIKQANTRNLTNSTIHISDGKIKFVNTNVAEPLTFKYLEKNLGEIIKNEDQVKLIIEQLKKRRNTKNVSEIKRFSSN